MTSRDRFAATMRFGAPDRVPLLEEGLRDEVLDAWHRQGLALDADLRVMFGTDRREEIPVDWEPRPKLGHGLLTPRGLEELARALDPEDPTRLPYDWAKRAAAWKTREHLLSLFIHDGLFLSMGIGNWESFDQVMDILAVDPGFASELMRIKGEFLAGYAARILRDVTPDFAILSEPICGNWGPLVSPAMYERIALRNYRPLLDALRRGGVETIVFMTYANARILIPPVLDCGFDCLWACETEPEAMDYLGIRKRFGRRLRLIGGIDLDCLLAGEDEIRREIETKVPVLLAGGGYIPLADGRVRANVPFSRYAFYRRMLARVAGPGTG